jgi:hypothetical protein
MTEHRIPAPAAIAAVIAEMEHYDRAWQKELADLRTTGGEIDERRLGEYEHAKDDHAWPVLDTLPDWISTLKSAIAPTAAPETGPQSAP